jgi:predicted methyltransferase
VTPLLTLEVAQQLQTARRAGLMSLPCSLDLKRSSEQIEIGASSWMHRGKPYPYFDKCKDRTVYYWANSAFEPVARYTGSLIKLVPTDWGPPTFEIDGIKMLPTARVSPYEDAERKVRLIRPKGKRILDTCGGLGYFAAWCLELKASQVQSYEKNADVLWLRSLNPWSPGYGGLFTLSHADVTQEIRGLSNRSVDAVLHDPPRFGIAGELYSQDFYDELARVLVPRGLLFHYTGTPNKLTSGRDLPSEVATRLKAAGFSVEKNGDGLLAVRRGAART